MRAERYFKRAVPLANFRHFPRISRRLCVCTSQLIPNIVNPCLEHEREGGPAIMSSRAIIHLRRDHKIQRLRVSPRKLKKIPKVRDKSVETWVRTETHMRTCGTTTRSFLRARYQDQELWFLSVPRDPCARVSHGEVRVRPYWATRASLSVSVYIWNVIRWLVASHGYLEKFRDGRGRREPRGVCRERGCNDAAGRGKDRGHKRPARRDARGGAPSFVAFRRASLHLLFSFFLLPHRPPTPYPPRVRRLSYRPSPPLSLVSLCSHGRRWYSAGIRRCGSVASAQSRFTKVGRRVCEKPASLTPARCAALLHRDELIKKNRGSCADISCCLCSREIAVRRGKDGPRRSLSSARGKREVTPRRNSFLYLRRAFSPMLIPTEFPRDCIWESCASRWRAISSVYPWIIINENCRPAFTAKFRVQHLIARRVKHYRLINDP